MASIRTLRDNDGLKGIHEELVYTEARLLARPETKDLAQSITDLIARCAVVQADQLEAQRQETIAEAMVDSADDELDDEVDAIALDVAYACGGDKQSGRYKRYFPDSVSAVTKLGLDSETKKVTPWVMWLGAETEPKLKDHGTRLTSVLADARAALSTRVAAASKRSNHHANDLQNFVDDVNAARLSILGELTKRQATFKKSSDWATRFFRRTHRSAKVDAAEPAATPAASAK
jgi:hypothetical protein